MREKIMGMNEPVIELHGVSCLWRWLTYWKDMCHYFFINYTDTFAYAKKQSYVFTIIVMQSGYHIFSYQHTEAKTKYILQMTSSNAFSCIRSVVLIPIWLRFVPIGPLNIKPILVLLMVRHQIGDKPLSEVMMSQFTDAYMCHSALMV